jgi:CIC family chloride channel protein
VPQASFAKPPASGNAYLRDLLETSLLAAIVGALTGLVAVGVRLVIAFITGVFFRQELRISFLTPQVHSLGPWVILVPAVGGLLAYLVVRWAAGDDRIRGATEVVRGVSTRKGKVSPRKLAGHATATMVSVGSGGSAGREGAMVQLGGALGQMASAVTGSSARHRKILLAAGGAAAIGSTFNTPIAGVIFAHEVILVEWTTRSFIPLTVASAMGTLVSTQFLGTEPAFPIPEYQLVTGYEIWLYLLLGVLAGLLAIAVLRSLSVSDRAFQLFPGPVWVRPVLGGLLVGVIGYLIPEVFGVGYETVRDALMGDFVAVGLAVILLAKLVAFAITRGSGGASGAFSPSLFLGSALGGVFGAVVNAVLPGQVGSAGAYALVGMAAVYAAVTRASLTAVVMLYEMTHTFSIVIPVMLTVAVADALSKAYGEGNFYRRSGRPGGSTLETDASVNILDVVSVGEIMTKKVETVSADGPVRQFIEKRFATGHQGYPVMDRLGNLVGIVTSTDLREKVKDEDLDQPTRRYMTMDVVSVTASTTAHEALTEMSRLAIGHLPVVDEKDPKKLVGFLTRSDLIGVERRILEDETRERPYLPDALWPFRRGGD